MPLLKRRGFTLVEILIVAIVVALLAAIAVPSILRSRKDANETGAQATLRNFSTACETYASVNSNFPEQMSYLTNADSPYFNYDPTASPKDGYSYTADLAAAGYTVTATPINSNLGRWDYRIIAGALLQRRSSEGGSWEAF